MRVEERKGGMGSRDQFPIGMRVLAVDDDPVCLKLLETLLLRCKYHVTTTIQAISALKLLRENKDKFDLVISDVHMPDMDGFMLLERVGLEMDLPVIMLSANGDTRAVMKGITHGACDYLLKPVRLEELKNIWQHVVRRKSNFCEKNNNHHINVEDSDGEKLQNPDSRFPQGQSGNLTKKRKDQNEGEEEGGDDSNGENEDLDPTAQKKPRVVWSVDLHRKFVSAVHQLGIDKAVPKRILELMNVEKLTRENVASHLQKYRLYLKRLSAVASQQASLAAAFGGRGDPSSYLRMGMFEGLQSYHPLAASSSVPPSLSPFQPTGGAPLLPQTNHSSLGLPGLPSSLPNNPLPNNALNDLNKFQLVNLPGNPNQASLIDNLPNEFSFSNVANNNLLPQKSQELIGTPFPGKNIFQIVPSFENRCVNRVENPSPPDDIIIGRDIKCESGLFREDPKLLSFSSGGNSVQKTNWRQQDDFHESSLLLNSYLDSQIPNSCSSFTETGQVITNNTNNLVQRLNEGFSAQRANVIGPNNSSSGPSFLTNCQSQVKHRDDYGLMVSKVQSGYGSNVCSFDGLLNSMIKLERDEISFSDGDMGCELYPLGAHM